MTKILNKNTVDKVKDGDVNTLVITSLNPNEDGFYEAQVNGQEVELIIGGSPCQSSL